MYTVKINYGGLESEYHYKTKKQAMRHWAGWYTHALDMYGQIEDNKIEIWHKGECIFADMM